MRKGQTSGVRVSQPEGTASAKALGHIGGTVSADVAGEDSRRVRPEMSRGNGMDWGSWEATGGPWTFL